VDIVAFVVVGIVVFAVAGTVVDIEDNLVVDTVVFVVVGIVVFAVEYIEDNLVERLEVIETFDYYILALIPYLFIIIRK
jgi:hypothetical protein